MPQELICPHCGQVVQADPLNGSIDALEPFHAAHTLEILIPGTFCGDHDRITTQSAGDAGPSATPPGTAPLGFRNEKGDESFDPYDSGSQEALPSLDGSSFEFDPLAAPIPDSNLEVLVDRRTGGRSASDAAEESGGHAAPEVSVADPGSSSASVTPDEGDEDEAAVAWPFVLLASYASAVTLALAWLLWTGHGRAASSRDTLPTPARTDPLKRVASLAPLGKDRITVLGRPLAVGSLEFTPLEITAGPVPLKGEKTGVGEEALILRVRFKNVSKHSTFAPLDRASIRVDDSGDSQTMIVTGGEPIETFPLAVASERSIVGQSLAALRPGETRETILVSEGDARAKFSPAMTWRISLHVGGDRTEPVGVKFTPDDVQ